MMVSKHRTHVVRMPVVLAGFGRVGRAFFRLLEEKAEDCRKRYDIELPVVAVLRSGGGYVSAAGLRSEDVFDGDSPAPASAETWREKIRLDGIFRESDRGCLVECTPTDLETGGPALDYCRSALRSGWHVASASKGALATAFRELRDLAATHGAALKFSGATAAALPTLDTGRFALAGAQIESIEAVLTGTANFILSRMGEGLSFEDALEEAREKGIAEPDPSLDIDGGDTSAKLVLIANSVLDREFSLKDVPTEGIRRITSEDIAAARKQNLELKLIGSCRKDPGGNWRLQTSVRSVDSTHPLFNVRGTEKGIVYHTDTMGSVVVTGGRSNPRGTAAALLKDILNIRRGIL